MARVCFVAHRKPTIYENDTVLLSSMLIRVIMLQATIKSIGPPQMNVMTLVQQQHHTSCVDGLACLLDGPELQLTCASKALTPVFIAGMCRDCVQFRHYTAVCFSTSSWLLHYCFWCSFHAHYLNCKQWYKSASHLSDSTA